MFAFVSQYTLHRNMLYVQFEELRSLVVVANFFLKIHTISLAVRIFICRIYATSLSARISICRIHAVSLSEAIFICRIHAITQSEAIFICKILATALSETIFICRILATALSETISFCRTAHHSLWEWLSFYRIEVHSQLGLNFRLENDTNTREATIFCLLEADYLVLAMYFDLKNVVYRLLAIVRDVETRPYTLIDFIYSWWRYQVNGDKATYDTCTTHSVGRM